MFFSKIRSRLRKRVTNEALAQTLCLLSERQERHGKAIAALGDMLELLDKRLQKHFEGLEKNDMAIGEAVDREASRLREDIGVLKNITVAMGEALLATPLAKKEGDLPSEALLKKEWFGEDD